MILFNHIDSDLDQGRDWSTRKGATLTYNELTVGLSPKNSQALLLVPVFVGGDSTDIETFIEDVYQKPVTDANYRDVAQEFKVWYASVAPDEYHEPTPTPSLLRAMSDNKIGRPPIGNEAGKKRSLHATDETWQWLGEVGGGSQAKGLRQLHKMFKLKDRKWKLLEWYRGCPIEYRPNMQRRGFLSIYHNHYHDGRIGSFVHHSLETARKHIDRLYEDLGDRIGLTEDEYREWTS